jgi:hypothetical protein
MAMLYTSTGQLDRSHYYMGRLYELEGYNDISAAFYKKAVEINLYSKAAERLERKQSVLPTTQLLFQTLYPIAVTGNSQKRLYFSINLRYNTLSGGRRLTHQSVVMSIRCAAIPTNIFFVFDIF